MTELAPSRVAPFGHPRINACVPLPLAYRSLPRPSSPLCAQASSTCYRSLDYKVGSLEIDPLISHSPPRSCIQAEHAQLQTRNVRNCCVPRYFLFTSEHSITLLAFANQRLACSCDSSIPRSTIRFCCQIALTQTPPWLFRAGGGVEPRKIELGCDVRVKRLQECFRVRWSSLYSRIR